MAADEPLPLEKSDADWRRELAPASYQVLRKHGTEPAGSSPLGLRAAVVRLRCQV
jgi:peptide-methionine (R)-S-oxide reductase